MYTDIKLL